MANIIIKTDQRRAQEAKVMRQFGYDPRRASSAVKEQMECIAAKDREIFRKAERRKPHV